MAAVTDTTELTYNEVLATIRQNLGQDAWCYADLHADDTFFDLCNQAGIDVVRAGNGSVLGYYKHVEGSKPLSSTEELAQSFNSNLQSGTAAAENTGAFTEIVNTTAQEGGNIQLTPTLTKFTDGVKGVLNTPVAGKITPAIMAAATGIQLGKTIDSAIYNIGNAMGLNPPEELNPDTWNSITQDMSDKGLEGIDKWAFNTIFGLDPDTGKATMYADENAFAYMAQYLQNIGIFNTDLTMKPIPDGMPSVLKTGEIYVANGRGNYWTRTDAPDDPHAFFYRDEAGDRVSYSGGSGSYFAISASGHTFSGQQGSYTFNNKTVYFRTNSNLGAVILRSIPKGSELSQSTFNSYYKEIAWLMIYNVAAGIDGVTDQPNATTPNLSTVTTPEDTLNLLKQTYPDLWNNAVQQDVMQPDGSVKTYTYVPLPMPTEGEGNQVGTTGATQNNAVVDPKGTTESQLATLIKILTDSQTKPQAQTETLPQDYPINPTPTTNPTDTGDGKTPVVVPVTGSASSLYAIYNPTLSEINDFGAWLWSDNFIEQIKKLFSDPMQAIIGLHKVYATPATGGSQNIKVGYLDSGVASKVVTNQYTTIDCGTVACSEYFGNVFDYDPYTSIQLYLPFIGIVNLDTADVMRSSIHVIYHVDVLTGACLAEVQVTRDSAGGTLYQYAGNAAVTLPISSGSYMGIVASLASIAGGVAGTLASGGAAAPMLIGAAGSALNARTRVEHSGGFSGNAGAMGGKIPYLIISRPQTELAENYSVYIGNPSNSTVSLGSCTGYVKVKECHLEGINATQNELNTIESLLKGGVLI